MKAGKLSLLALALVFGLSACNLLNPGEDDPSDATDPTTTTDPTDATDATDPTDPTDATDPTDPTAPTDDPTDPASAPTGSFGVANTPAGPFQYSGDDQAPITDDDDPRIIDVAAGGSFFAQVDYADPDGITDAKIVLVNSMPEGLSGSLGEVSPVGGFTLAGPPTGCDLSAAATEVTCVYEINVAPGTVDIEELPGSGDEFAYVFRTQVTDAAGNTSRELIRGYVNID
jgi:hypothetical protein